VTIDGGTAEVNNAIDFSAAVDWDDIITILNASFTGTAAGSTWSYDEEEHRIMLTSNSTGASSSVALADGSGTAIRGATMLNIAISTPVAGS